MLFASDIMSVSVENEKQAAEAFERAAVHQRQEMEIAEMRSELRRLKEEKRQRLMSDIEELKSMVKDSDIKSKVDDIERDIEAIGF